MIQFLKGVCLGESVIQGVLLTGCAPKLAGQSLRMRTIWRAGARACARTRGDSFLIICGFVTRKNAGPRVCISVYRLGGGETCLRHGPVAGTGQCFPFVKSRKNPCFLVAPHGISGMLMQPRSLEGHCGKTRDALSTHARESVRRRPYRHGATQIKKEDFRGTRPHAKPRRHSFHAYSHLR